MNETAVMDKLVGLIRPYAKNQEALASVTTDTHILKDLKVNSARLVDIIIAIEDDFDIEVSDDEANQVGTIGDATQMIVEKLQ